MAAATNFHSAIVGWLKILLPLAALMLLSTLFLFARSTAPSDDIPFADIDAAAAEQRVSAPAVFRADQTRATRSRFQCRGGAPDANGGSDVDIDRPHLSLTAPMARPAGHAGTGC